MTHEEAILIDALATVRRGWTQKAWARDEDGFSVNENGNTACEWCLSGAIRRAWATTGGKEDTYRSAVAVVTETIRRQNEIPNPGVRCSTIHWNDAPGRTQEDAIALLENTIRRLQDNERN